MTRKNLAELYEIDYSTLWNYCKKFKRKIDSMATKINIRGRKVKRNKLNRHQIQFIVKNVMQDPPEGYKCVNGLLIKISPDER